MILFLQREVKFFDDADLNYSTKLSAFDGSREEELTEVRFCF
jgi:hypothetical protein